MKTQQLPPDTQVKIHQIEQYIERVLSSSLSPHTRAVSQSSLPVNESRDGVMHGGALLAPTKPPFVYDNKALSALHRDALRSTEGLHAIVVLAERAEPGAPWRCRVKVVSVDEHRGIVAARRAYDTRVEAALRRIMDDAEYVAFGRDTRGRPARLIRKTADGVIDLPPGEEFLGLLRATEDLYCEHDLDLIVSRWTLRPAGLDFREYFE